jgi:hypothetical protein
MLTYRSFALPSSVMANDPQVYRRRTAVPKGKPMRWQRLFDDLEAQVEQADQAMLDAEIADRTRREMARIRLADRLRASAGESVASRVSGLGLLRGVVEASGPDWLLVTEPVGSEVLVPLRAVLTVSGLSGRAAVPGSEGVVDARLGLGYALRRIARDRSAVVVTLADGSTARGVVDRVGADAFDLAEPVLSGARPAPAKSWLTVPFHAVSAVRRTV